MSDPAEIKLTYERVGRKGSIRLLVDLPGGTPFTDTFDVTKFRAREQFLDHLCDGKEGLPLDSIRAQLEAIAAEMVGSNESDVSDDSDVSSADTKQADQLVLLASDIDFIKTPGGHDSEAYAVITTKDYRETLLVESKAFRRWLTRKYYEKYRTAPGAQALTDALGVLVGRALYESEEHEVAVRIAGDGGTMYWDLGDAEFRVVEVTATGWRVVSSLDVPVYFARKRGMLALPVPVEGGSVDELRPLLNVRDDAEWTLVVAFLVGALRPTGPYPILRVEGEYGAAKSYLCRLCRALIDPSRAPLRRPPRSERDLMISASNAWMIVFENLSSIPQWLSDALCTVSTGGGFATRELYADGDEKIFDVQRPIIVNGIGNVGDKPDFLNRCSTLNLPQIPDGGRKTEAAVLEEFERVQPRVLGALLDAVSCALRRINTVEVESLPRMADYVKWIIAAEPALGWTEGRFLSVFTENRDQADRIAVESALIGPPILILVKEGPWEGTATDLVVALEARAEEQVKKSKEWPGTAKKMGWAIKQLAPSLRGIGLEVELDRTSDEARTRNISLVKRAERTSETSETSDAGRDDPQEPQEPDCDGRSSDVSTAGAYENRPAPNGPDAPVAAHSDVPDVPDVSPPITNTGGAVSEEAGEWKF